MFSSSVFSFIAAAMGHKAGFLNMHTAVFKPGAVQRFHRFHGILKVHFHKAMTSGTSCLFIKHDPRLDNVPVIIKNPPLTGVPETRVENSISPLAFGLSTVIDYKNHHLIMARRLPEEPSDCGRLESV